MAFSTMLRRCLSGGTSSYDTFETDPSASTVVSMATLILAEHWLSRIWCLVVQDLVLGDYPLALHSFKDRGLYGDERAFRLVFEGLDPR